VLRIAPPLTVTEDEIDQAAEVLVGIIERLD
jgi:4-aminobutyrate aminotransferase-like enzyme